MTDNLFTRTEKTICAVSTPPGFGGIAIVRVSGPAVVRVVRQVASFLPEKPESHRIYYGFLKHPQNQKKIDEVLISFFERGRSFTNEDVCEISCHGNPLICDEILQSLVLSGASIADRGEFTFRAFMNGRLDLAQAESVLSLIESQSRSAKTLALRQLEGHLSGQISAIEAELIHLLAHIEADIDFSTENLETISKPEATQKIAAQSRIMSDFIRQYEQGRLLREGIRVSFFGLPNVGKSSLFNALVQRERAIVTDIPGTTRDVLDAETSYKGIRFCFFDTAGVRHGTQDVVEQIGIEKTFEVNQSADVSLFVSEAHREFLLEEKEYLKSHPQKKQIFILNKADLGARRADTPDSLVVSALDPDCRVQILEKILAVVGVEQSMEDVAVISQTRHYELLLSARSHLYEAEELCRNNLGLELVALELKSALLKIQEILGKFYDDQILDEIFKEFCLGK